MLTASVILAEMLLLPSGYVLASYLFVGLFSCLCLSEALLKKLWMNIHEFLIAFPWDQNELISSVGNSASGNSFYFL